MPQIKGITVNAGVTAAELVASYANAGLQASELAKSVQVIRDMKAAHATVFLTFTSNMVSSGLRELFAQLCREKFVDVVITNVGSIEEDVMKSFAPFKLGSFDADDAALHEAGDNRVGNIIIPSSAYVRLEKFLLPFFAELEARQTKEARCSSPSEVARELGLRLKDENSFLYWCARNNIPVFCPAPTDGAFGLQLFYYKQDHPRFCLDVTGDMRALAKIVLESDKTGGIILGGGAAKHHAIGAQLARGGFDYAVYVSTGSQYDGSLSGARVTEAVSWGKVKSRARVANVECDASLAFPLIAAALKG
ncbi:MAG: deoxyhypusine synthase family protein [Candidatus Micrarchaeia archaeon]